jgi:hypothetical protein
MVCGCFAKRAPSEPISVTVSQDNIAAANPYKNAMPVLLGSSHTLKTEVDEPELGRTKNVQPLFPIRTESSPRVACQIAEEEEETAEFFDPSSSPICDWIPSERISLDVGVQAEPDIQQHDVSEKMTDWPTKSQSRLASRNFSSCTSHRAISHSRWILLSQMVRSSSKSLLRLTGQPRQDTLSAFTGDEESVPPIGGCQGLRVDAHSNWLLPEEVVLFEPSIEEIFQGGQAGMQKPAARQIFLNTELTAVEIAALHKFRQAMPRGEFPESMAVHALRMIHNCKFKISKAVEMVQTLQRERVQRLPLLEEDVLEDLQSGFLYWHGRDHKCRPCLVIRLERLGRMARDKELAVRLVMFALEYAIRFAMVPGRVENWVVILDLANVLNVVSIFHIGSLISTAMALAMTLETIYCGRMAWMKIVNMPGSSVVAKAVNSAIPVDKRHKVSCPLDAHTELLKHMNPNQLEERYGGSAPTLQPKDTYPYHFFPNASRESCNQSSSSLHNEAPLSLHEGFLWDPEVINDWLPRAEMASLTPLAVQSLKKMVPDSQVEPCQDLVRWRKLMAASKAEFGSGIGTKWFLKAAEWLKAGAVKKQC